MFSFIGKLLGTEKALELGASAIDKLNLTEQESINLKIELLKAAHPFKVAQRLFMLLVTIPYMTVWCIAIGLYLKTGSKDLFNLLLSDRVGDVFLAMAIFYFGGGTINTLTNIRKGS